MVTTTLAEKVSFADIESQIRENQKKVDFDVKEFTIEYYVDKFKKGDFFVPEYQRDFVWDKKRQSKFIESVVLGLPIPFIFVADVYGRDDKDDESEEGNLEIVDGSQRIRTLAAFIDNQLQLTDLEILDKLNGLYFENFPQSRQKRILNTSIKIIQFSDGVSAHIRFMIFERINTGGVIFEKNELIKSLERIKNSSRSG